MNLQNSSFLQLDPEVPAGEKPAGGDGASYENGRHGSGKKKGLLMDPGKEQLRGSAENTRRAWVAKPGQRRSVEGAVL